MELERKMDASTITVKDVNAHLEELIEPVCGPSGRRVDMDTTINPLDLTGLYGILLPALFSGWH